MMRGVPQPDATPDEDPDPSLPDDEASVDGRSGPGAPEGEDVGSGAPDVDALGAVPTGAEPDPTAADRWAATVLGIEQPADASGSWLDGRVASRLLAAHERTSALVALAEPDDLIEHVAFARDEPTDVRTEDVAVGPDDERAVPEAGTMVAWRHEGAPVISWVEIDPDGGGVRLVAVGAERAVSEEAVDALVAAIEGPASTWRGRAVVVDPGVEGLLAHLPTLPEVPAVLAEDLLEELERDLVVPIRGWDELQDTVPRRAVLLYGPPGTGKRLAVRHVLGRLDGVTRLVLAARCLLHGELVRAAFELAASAAPALVVLEDLDVVVGDWGASPAPEGLVELVAQLDGPVAPRGVFTVATTNYGQSVDVSFGRRTGRFDRLLEVGSPAPRHRRALLAEVVARRVDEGDATARDRVVERLVGRTEGWTVAQLRELERLAVLEAARTSSPCDLVAAVELVRHQVHRHAPGTGGSADQAGSYL